MASATQSLVFWPSRLDQAVIPMKVAVSLVVRLKKKKKKINRNTVTKMCNACGSCLKNWGNPPPNTQAVPLISVLFSCYLEHSRGVGVKIETPEKQEAVAQYPTSLCCLRTS